MTMANYPSGFADGIMIRGIPLTVMHPGKVFWVGNATAAAMANQKTYSDGNKGTFNEPFATLDKALSFCQASRGDIIFLKPGHSEAITTAGGVDVDIAGVAIVGLGAGTLRPKFTFGAAAATFVVSAANVSFYNIEWQANFADVATGLDVSGVDGLTWDSCYFTESGTDLNFVDVIDLATGADDIHINKCKFIGGDAANDSFITGVAHSGLYIHDSVFYANVAQTSVVGLIETSGNATNVEIKRCSFRSNVDGALFIDFNGTANGGVVAECYFSSIDTAGAVAGGFDFTGGHVFECYVAGEADTYGIVGGGTAYNDA